MAIGQPRFKAGAFTPTPNTSHNFGPTTSPATVPLSNGSTDGNMSNGGSQVSSVIREGQAVSPSSNQSGTSPSKFGYGGTVNDGYASFTTFELTWGQRKAPPGSADANSVNTSHDLDDRDSDDPDAAVMRYGR